jgi:GTP-binding protein
MEIKSAEFVISNTRIDRCPQTGLPEYAFIGRSNVGKSSLINMLTRKPKLAMTSATPGKTMLINHFIINKAWYLVDLPGYGYAQVSRSEKERWGKLMEDYFAAGRITLGVLIVDYRHAPTNNDITMARWFIDSGCPFVVVANKMDKLKKSELEPNLVTIREDLELPEGTVIIPFSAEKGNGKDELVRMILEAVKK